MRKMLRVPIVSAKPGMVLAMPVYHPRRQDTALLASGVTLDARSIQRLREINLGEVWVEYPPLAFLSAYVSPEIAAAHAELAHSVSGAFDALAAAAHARLDYRAYRRSISGLLDSLVSTPKAAIFVQEMVDRDQPALRHAVATCFVSLLMGLKLDDYLITQRSRLRSAAARDVSTLGLGALFHDVGMLRLDDDVLDRWHKLGDETDPDWREHVHLGFEMVRGNIGPAAAAAVLHHHQCWNGAGFPRKTLLDGGVRPIAGSEIHVFARIIAAADAYDRARHPRHARRARPPVRALRLVREQVGTRLDPMTFKALLAVVPAYAPGSIVTLSNGMRAVVTQWYPEEPCRPTVFAGEDLDKGFRDEDPNLTRVALREHPHISIVQADGADVSADNFEEDEPGEFDLRRAGRALFNQAEETYNRRAG